MQLVKTINNNLVAIEYPIFEQDLLVHVFAGLNPQCHNFIPSTTTRMNQVSCYSVMKGF